MRERFNYSTANREGIRGDQGEKEAYRYSAGLIIHASLQNAARGLKTNFYWTVAQESTGYGIVYDVSRKQARFAAAVLSGLPVDWTLNQTDFLAAFGEQPQVVKEIVARLRKLEYERSQRSADLEAAEESQAAGAGTNAEEDAEAESSAT